MESEMYTLFVNDKLEKIINDFLTEYKTEKLPDVVFFKDTLSETEILKYIPFHNYAYNNTPGLEGEDSIEKEIKSFKNQLKTKNEHPKTESNFYFFLMLSDEIIGMANCRINDSQFARLFIDYIFIEKNHTAKKFGKYLLYNLIDKTLKLIKFDKIELQTHSNNLPAYNLITNLGFKKTK